MTPAGVIRTLEVPRAATGPDWNALLLGSEGTLGVIVEATLRVRPAPERVEERGMLFRSFADGVAAVRAVRRAGSASRCCACPTPAETELSLVLRHDPARRVDPTALGALALAERLGYGAVAAR